MEDVKKDQVMTEDKPEETQVQNAEEDSDVEVFRTIESKMGGEESNILECVKLVYEQYFKALDDEFAKDREELVKHYDPICEKVQKSLKDEKLGDWSVVAGERFASVLGLRQAERYACFQIGKISVAVVEYK